MISSGGVIVEQNKVREITEWPRPTTVIEVKSFLGLTGYNKRFVEIFS